MQYKICNVYAIIFLCCYGFSCHATSIGISKKTKDYVISSEFVGRIKIVSTVEVSNIPAYTQEIKAVVVDDFRGEFPAGKEIVFLSRKITKSSQELFVILEKFDENFFQFLCKECDLKRFSNHLAAQTVYISEYEIFSLSAGGSDKEVISLAIDTAHHYGMSQEEFPVLLINGLPGKEIVLYTEVKNQMLKYLGLRGVAPSEI